MTDHTPTPWISQPFCDDEDHAVFIIGANLGGLAATAPMFPSEIDTVDSSRAQANAAFIVKAVNNHDALVEALEGLDLLLDFGDEPGSIWTFDDPTAIREAFKRARAALSDVGDAGTP
jgi:hypothetical protein